MYSFSFPDIFANGRTNLLQDKEAAKSNLKLVIGAEKKTLLGDPYFGTQIKKYMFSQISQPFKDLIAEEIYMAIKQYVPQIFVKRENIEVCSDRARIFVNIKYQYITDKSLDMFTIDLMEEE